MLVDQSLAKAAVKAPIKHWFLPLGLNFLDLYDVTCKLVILRGASMNWDVMPFVATHFFPKLFHTYFLKWQKSNKNYLAIPAGTKTHWTYILVDRKRKAIEHWDSLGNKNSLCNRITRLRLLLVLKYMQRYVDPSFKIVNVVNRTHQWKNKNCGIYVMRFLEERMKGVEPVMVANNLNYDINKYKARFLRIRSAKLSEIRKWTPIK